MLGDDFHRVIGTLDKRGGKPGDIRKASTIEMKDWIKTHNLLYTWPYKNPELYVGEPLDENTM